jgi:phage-related protein
MRDLPKLQAVFFQTTSGREPVREWLLSLDKAERRQLGTDIAYVQYKWPIGKPRVDHLRGGIWEIRTRLENRISRVLFAVEDGEMVLLHGLIKKTQKTAQDDIELAESRWKDWKNGQGK